MSHWIFLSAHFDDVVLSAGGLVWELARQGDQVEIWTICAGDPPSDKPLTGYARRGARQQRLSRAGRTDHQHIIF